MGYCGLNDFPHSITPALQHSITPSPQHSITSRFVNLVAKAKLLTPESRREFSRENHSGRPIARVARRDARARKKTRRDQRLFRSAAFGARDLSGNRARSEERRVGKECRSRWSPNH